MVFDRARRVTPIVAARSAKEATEILGNAASLFRPIEIPPLAHHRGDVPRILDELWADLGKRYRHERLAPDRLAAMTAYGWKSNRSELRDVAVRLAAIFDHGGSVRAAAKSLGQNYDWVRQSLLRCGAIAAVPRAGADDDV